MCRPDRVGIDREESELHISHGMGAAGVKRHMIGLLGHRVEHARARCAPGGRSTRTRGVLRAQAKGKEREDAGCCISASSKGCGHAARGFSVFGAFLPVAVSL